MKKSKEPENKSLSGAVQLLSVQAKIQDLIAQESDVGDKLADKIGEREEKRAERAEEQKRKNVLDARYSYGACEESEVIESMNKLREMDIEIENLTELIEILQGRKADLDYQKECEQEQEKLANTTFFRQVVHKKMEELKENAPFMDLLKTIKIACTPGCVSPYFEQDFWRELLGGGGEVSAEDRQRLHAEIRKQYLEPVLEAK